MRFAFALPCLFLCSIARADSLADLQSALARLRGLDAVKASVDYAIISTEGDEKTNPAAPVPVNALVESGAEGLRITWLPTQIAALAPDAPGSTNEERNARKRAMDSLGVSTLSNYLNGAPLLLKALEHATLLEEKNSTWRDRPARMLVLKLDPPMGEKARKYVKSFAATVTIWLGSEGLPIAAQRQQHVKGRAMLVIGFESTEKEEYEFLFHGDHLLVTKHTKDVSGSGGGESNQRQIAATLALIES